MNNKKIMSVVLIMTFMLVSMLGFSIDTPVSYAETKTQTQDFLSVHYIDVGQGDAILLQQNDKYMLIDAGENNQGKVVVDYLNKMKIKTLDYVVGTHPHSDHIGGLDTVIKSFNVKNVMMPKVVHTTDTYKDVLLAVKDKKLTITSPVPGTTYDFGSAKITVLAPNNSKYDDLNNYSIVLRVTFGDNSFLFTGDAEALSEKEILKLKNVVLKSDVLKVGHHGSDSSTSADFLKQVSPKYAVIQVGKDNEYKHPTESTLKALEKAKVTVYRSDLNGNIVAKSDGKNITFTTTKNLTTVVNKDAQPAKTATTVVKKDTQPIVQAAQIRYIGNINSKKYHVSSCRSLPDEKNSIYFDTKEAAEKAGYVPCKICKP